MDYWALLVANCSSLIAVSKESACSAEDLGSVPELRRSPEEGNSKPLQHPCLEIRWTEELGGLQLMGSQRVGHD